MNKKLCPVFSISLILVLLFGVQSLYSQNSELQSGVKLYNENKFNEATLVFESILKNTNSSEANFYLGKILFETTDFDYNYNEDIVEKAIAYFENASQIEPNNGIYHRYLGLSYLIKADDVFIFSSINLGKKGLDNLEKALVIDPNDLVSRLKLVEYYGARLWFLGGNKVKADDHVTELSKIDKYSWHLAKGFMFDQDEDWENSSKEYESAIQISSDDVDVFYKLGFLHYRYQKYESSYSVFSEIIRQYPESKNAYYQIGRIATTSMDPKFFDYAIECFKIYLEFEIDRRLPSKAWTHYRLGVIYETQNKPDLAKLEYENSIKANPDFSNAKKALKEIKK